RIDIVLGNRVQVRVEGQVATMEQLDEPAPGVEQAVVGGEISRARGKRQDAELVRRGRGEAAGQADVERAVECGRAADGQLVELAGRGARDLDIERAGRGLRVGAGDGQRARRVARVDLAGARDVGADRARALQSAAVEGEARRGGQGAVDRG